MDIKMLSNQIEEQFSNIFLNELDSKTPMPQREDSRSFGGMIEKRIADNWSNICANIGCNPLDRPGKRTIYDFALTINGTLVGIDIKTKDLDKSVYSDGGICAVSNLLRFLANIFLIAEFGHHKSTIKRDMRELSYILVSPFISFPEHIYRIENLGTGQIRLNATLEEVWDDIVWYRDVTDFYEFFIDIAVEHYLRVGSTASDRINYLKDFIHSGYKNFKFK